MAVYSSDGIIHSVPISSTQTYINVSNTMQQGYRSFSYSQSRLSGYTNDLADRILDKVEKMAPEERQLVKEILFDRLSII